MTKLIKGIYNRRHPERTDYYRIIESSFDGFERQYPDLFEEKQGFLRTGAMKAIYAFLLQGIYHLLTNRWSIIMESIPAHIVGKRREKIMKMRKK